jgi:hypothetical protein
MCDFGVAEAHFLRNEFSPTHDWSLDPNFLMGNGRAVGDSVCVLLWANLNVITKKSDV